MAKIDNVAGFRAKIGDSFQNLAARLGIGSDANNISQGGSYGFNPISRNRQILEWMYGGSWLVGVAVDAVADDMVSGGIAINSVDTPENIDKFAAALHELAVWPKLNETIKWSRLYGGAIAVLLIDGQTLNTPLQPRSIGKDQFKGLAVLDRWMIAPSLSEPIRTLGPDLGEPMFYDVTTDGGPLPRGRIHHSRVIRIDGIPQPYWRKIAENGWGLSVIEPLYDRLLAFDRTTQGVAQLVYKAHLRTLKVENLRQLIAIGGKALEGLAAQIDNMRLYQINEGITLLDTKDEFQVDSYSFTGLDEILMQFAQQLSGAMKIPLTRLFGQAPGGLNATGESDMRNYYDAIHAQQEARLRRPLTGLFDVIYRSVIGSEPPPGFTFVFKSLWQLSDGDKATFTASNTTAITSAFDSGIISPKTALKELRAISTTTGAFSSITDEEIESAEDEPAPPGEEGGDPEGGLFGEGPPGEGPPEGDEEKKDAEGEKEPPPFKGPPTQGAKDSDFREEDHPRSDNGQFGSGGGSRKVVLKPKASGNHQAAKKEFERISTPNPINERERLIGPPLGGVTMSVDAGEIHISDLRSIQRGGGREAMTAVLEIADEHGMTVGLHAVPGESPAGKKMTKVKLRAWYEGFGFKPDRGDYMIRAPKQAAKDSDFREEDHPRSDNGQFGSGGGSLSVSKGKTAGGVAATYDPKTKAYSAQGIDPARLKSLAIPPAWKDVRISSDPKARLQALGMDAKGRSQYRYSDEFAASQHAKKFQRVKVMTLGRGKVESYSLKGTKSGDSTAAAIRLMFLTGMRPGGDTETQAKEKAYGATTLTKDHVRVDGDNLIYDFVGKKGVRITNSVNDPALAKFVKGRLAKGSERIFDTTAARANSALKATMGAEYKCKDLRTMAANTLAATTIKEMNPPTDLKSKIAAIKFVAKKVSDQLGNTPSVALKDYINPIFFSSWDKVH